MPSEAEQRMFHVLSGEHLPDGSDVHVCPNCGHTFGGEVDDNFEMQPEEEDPKDALIAALATALTRGGL